MEISAANVMSVLLGIINLLLFAFTAVLWSYLQDVKKKGEENRSAFEAYKLHAAETYVTQSILTRAIEGLAEALKDIRASMEKRLDTIERKLDGKQDKN